MVRWSLTLQQFSFGVAYIRGETNVVADTLSRAPVGAPLTVGAIRLADFDAAPAPMQAEKQRGLESPLSEKRSWFDAVHNETVTGLGCIVTSRTESPLAPCARSTV